MNAFVLLQVVTFLAVIFALEGAYLFFRANNRQELAANRRMKIAAETNARILNPELFRRRMEGGVASRIVSALIPNFQALVWRAALGFTPSQFAIAMAVLAGLGWLIGAALLNLVGLPRFGFALIFGFGLPYAFLNMRADARTKTFRQQLPAAIDIIVRGLEAGHPAPVAIEMVSRELPDPIGSEFGLALDEMNYGKDRGVALRGIANRFPGPEVSFLVSAVEMQRETGGNLAEILSNLSRVIRERAAMQKKIWALSAEGRFSCFIVGGLPILLVMAIMAINPSYFTEVQTDPRFAPMLAAGAIAWVIGVVWIWKMVTFKF